MGKSKKTKIAVVVLNTGVGLEPWQEMNTIAHLNASFAARAGKSLFSQDQIQTKDGHYINLNIQHAIMIKQTDDSSIFASLSHQAKELDIHISEFTKEMLETTNDNKIIEITSEQEHEQVQYLGMLFFGEKEDVEKLTSTFALYTGSNNNVISTGANKVSEMKMTEANGLPTRKEAEQLVEKYLTDTKRHCEQVGNIMAWFAEKLGEEVEHWYLAGLLHDIDRDHIGKDPVEHLGGGFEEIVNEINLSQALIDDIRSHYSEKTGIPVDSTIRKYLASVDELSGFIHAYSLMRPTGLEGMSWKSLNKKIKDKQFASGVSREHIRNCEQYLDIPLSEFALEVITAMQEIDSRN